MVPEGQNSAASCRTRFPVQVKGRCIGVPSRHWTSTHIPTYIPGILACSNCTYHAKQLCGFILQQVWEHATVKAWPSRNNHKSIMCIFQTDASCMMNVRQQGLCMYDHVHGADSCAKHYFACINARPQVTAAQPMQCLASKMTPNLQLVDSWVISPYVVPNLKCSKQRNMLMLTWHIG